MCSSPAIVLSVISHRSSHRGSNYMSINAVIILKPRAPCILNMFFNDFTSIGLVQRGTYSLVVNFSEGNILIEINDCLWYLRVVGQHGFWSVAGSFTFQVSVVTPICPLIADERQRDIKMSLRYMPHLLYGLTNYPPSPITPVPRPRTTKTQVHTIQCQSISPISTPLL
jgi:hypothetical protein